MRNKHLLTKEEQLTSILIRTLRPSAPPLRRPLVLVPVIEVARMVEVVQRGALLLQPLGELLLAVGRPAVPASAVEVVGVVEVVET